MKKIILLLFFPILSFPQLHVDNNWGNRINPIFNDLEKNRIESGILLDYAMEFIDVPSYSGVLKENNYVDVNVFGNVYKTIFMGKVVADTTCTPHAGAELYSVSTHVARNV